MKVCSFLPAATSMIYEMGIDHLLHGTTFECPGDRPRVVRSHLEGNNYSSAEIETIVSEYARKGKSLYYVDTELLKEIQPDVIFTQHVCNVCQIGTANVEEAVVELEKKPRIIPLVPKTLEDVYLNALTIAREMGKEEAGLNLLAKLQQKTDSVLNRLRKNRSPLRKAMLMEWLDPVYNCGHWIPDQIAQAGGVDMLSNPSGYSVTTPWEKVQQYDPEVIVVAPCGFNVERSGKELDVLLRKSGWHDLKAVMNGEVYFADANLFTMPSTTLVDGIEVLASLFHPTLFHVPDQLKDKVLSLHDLQFKKLQL
jgi:iron complex transport system substrate-binding protein